MLDAFSAHSPSLMSPFSRATPITPHDTQDLPAATRGLLVTGLTSVVNVAVIMVDGSNAVTLPLATGQIHMLRVRRVLATQTTATSVTGLT